MSLSPRELLVRVGIPHQEKSNRLQLLCPFHDDTNPSAGFYLDTERFYCFTCDLSLDVIGFYAKFHGIPVRQARGQLVPGQLEESSPRRSMEWVQRKRSVIEQILKELKEVAGSQEFAILSEQVDQMMDQVVEGSLGQDEGESMLEGWYRMVEEVGVSK